MLSELLGGNQAGYIAPTTSQLGGCDDSNERSGADAFGLAAREGTATVKACAAKSLPSGSGSKPHAKHVCINY